MVSAAPLLASCLLLGTTAGVMTLWPGGYALAAAVAAAALACLATSRRGATPLVLLALTAGAVAHGAAARDGILHPSLMQWFDAIAGTGDRVLAPVIIDGTIAADATLSADNGDEEGVVGLLVLVERVRDATGWHPARGRVQLHVSGVQAPDRVREWTAGRRLQATSALRRPQLLLNFGGPSPFWQTLRRPFALTGSVKSAALVDVSPGRAWAEAASCARWRARDAAARFIAPRDPLAAGVITAILIGDRAGLSDELVRRLQAAGTYHVIAISGGNVALLTTLAFILLRLVVRSTRALAAAALVITVAYGAIVWSDASVARAVVAASLYLGATVAGVVPAPIATLRTAACLLVIADPLIVCDVGAWLSFGATLGILVLASRFGSVVAWDRIPAWIRPLARAAVLLVAATAAAECVLLPMAAAVFGRVTAAGFVLNLIAIPAMAVAQIAGLITVVAGPAWPAVGQWGGAIAARAADVLVGSSRLVDLLPWLAWRVPAASLAWIAAYYLAGLAASSTRFAARHRRWAAAAAGATLGAIVFVPGVGSAPAPGRLRISMLDVGQGDAILVQLPDGHSLLVDTGGSPGSFDIGTRVVTPAVWALGVRSLTWLALTHGDRDHVGGAVGVTEDLSPLEIWEGVPVPSHVELARIKHVAAVEGLVWRTVRAGARVEFGAARIDVVHPPEPDWERQRVRNDDSVVLRIRYGHVDVLLTGDAGGEFEQRLPTDFSASAIRILKAGHHGSKTSTSDRLVQALRPQAALISVGRGNLFGHPAPEVVDRLKAAGAEVFRTDQDGAVSLETDGVTVRIVTALGRWWSIVALESS